MARRRLRAAVVMVLAWAAPEGSAAAEAPPAYSLEVDSDDASLSFVTLAPQLAGDLDSPIAPAPAHGQVMFHVHYRVAKRELTVRVVFQSGRTLERSVIATGNEGDLLREAVLLASNLARDEARELLDSLTRPPAAATPPPSPAPMYHATLALAYPLATNLGRPEVGTHVDLSLLFGRVGRVDGAQVGLVATYASRGLSGAQVAAAVGAVRGDLAGAQVAVVASVVHGDTAGVQVAATTSIASGNVSGTQVATAFNLAQQVNGVQVAAGANLTRSVRGVQVGVVNVANDVRGMQVGVINIADGVDGQQLGLISISRKSVHPIAWGSNLAYTNAGFKFVGRYAYTTTAVTFGTNETAFDEVGVTVALGTRLPLVPVWRRLVMEPEIALTSISTKDGDGDNFWLTPRLQVGWSFFERLRVFAGVGSRFGLTVSDGRKVIRPEVLGGLEF